MDRDWWNSSSNSPTRTLSLLVADYGNMLTAVSAIKGGAAGTIEGAFMEAYFIKRVKSIFQKKHTVTHDAARAVTPKELCVF